MTIDMLRHKSIRETVMHATAIHPETIRADGVQRWIAQARRAARRPAFAVRNLPAGISPGRAADLMEATAAAGRERKRRAGLKGWQCRVRKPAFALTLYWDGEPPADESAATSEALVILDAADLQTVIVRGVDADGPCSILILNVVHPVTGRAKVRRQELYLDLMRWHLHRDMDAADYAALRGKADTFEQSLARQDLRWHPVRNPWYFPFHHRTRPFTWHNN